MAQQSSADLEANIRSMIAEAIAFERDDCAIKACRRHGRCQRLPRDEAGRSCLDFIKPRFSLFWESVYNLSGDMLCGVHSDFRAEDPVAAILEWHIITFIGATCRHRLPATFTRWVRKYRKHARPRRWACRRSRRIWAAPRKRWWAIRNSRSFRAYAARFPLLSNCAKQSLFSAYFPSLFWSAPFPYALAGAEICSEPASMGVQS